jgi:aspartate aminotransferase-like enzyme
MGESCKASNVLLVLSALETILTQQGYAQYNGNSVAAAQQALAAT